MVLCIVYSAAQRIILLIGISKYALFGIYTIIFFTCKQTFTDSRMLALHAEYFNVSLRNCYGAVT